MSAYSNRGSGRAALGAANKAELFTARGGLAGAGAAAIGGSMVSSSREAVGAGYGGGGGYSNAGPPGSSRVPDSSRVPVSSRSAAASVDDNRLPSNRDRLQSEYGLSSDADDPLQLEHMLGYSGNYRMTALSIPNKDSHCAKSMGSLISLQSLVDCHDQRLLRGHDNQITTLAISPSGSLIASGQIGTKHFRGDAAPIFIWSTETGERVGVMKGISLKVNVLGFSTDEKFLCGSGEDLLLYIWDVATGEVVYGRRLNSRITVLHWIEHAPDRNNPHYTEYSLALGLDSFLHRGVFSYDPNKVQWQLVTDKYLLPPGGNLVRDFTCIAVSADLEFVYVGTTGGEMLVLMRRTNVFRSIIPVCSNALTSIAVLSNEDVLCSGGDGSLSRLNGRDMAWRVVMQTSLGCYINNISLNSSETEALVTCSTGAVYRYNSNDFRTNTIVSDAHTAPVRSITFVPDSTLFVTGTSSGEIRSWDIIDYACQSILQLPKSGSVMTLCTVDNTYLLSGWEDGFIRCHDLATLNRQLWSLNAHRNGVTSLGVSCGNSGIGNPLNYIVSGGGEGTVRVWKLDSREPLTQHSEHSRAVAKVLIDCKTKNLIHSVGVDGSVLTFDLRTNSRRASHLTNGSIISDMTQRLDSEQEVVTCDAVGRLMFWDIDYREAVLNMQDPSRTCIKCCCVSPSGKYLAFAGEDQLLKVLELSTGRVLSLGQGHSNTINALSWTFDEKQIVTAGEDGCLCIWNFYLGGN